MALKHEETRQEYNRLLKECSTLIKELKEIKKEYTDSKQLYHIKRLENKLNRIEKALNDIPWKYAQAFSMIQLEYIGSILLAVKKITSPDEDPESE